jgi:1-acyl-sn-glycerol-3-phosphate acyltransferase
MSEPEIVRLGPPDVSGAELSAPARLNGHTPPAGPREAAVPDRPADEWDRRVADALAFLRRRLTGDYEVDEFGFDRELTEQVFHPLGRRLLRDWFRAELFGVEHLPTSGPGLVVGNHSGTIALDALMLAVAVHEALPGAAGQGRADGAIRAAQPTGRHLRLLGADLVFRLPLVSELARKSGGTVACNADAERLLGAGELVGVFPEGFKGIGKPYRERYKLQRFGRGGFVSAALRTGTPIVPVAIVGAEEIYPLLANFPPLARLLGLPYFPITPTFPWLGPLGLLPYPVRYRIVYGEPLALHQQLPREAADDRPRMAEMAARIRLTVQHLVDRNR